MNTSITMEQTPETSSLLAKISGYLTIIIAAVGGLVTIFGYFKFARGRWKNFRNWCGQMAELPKIAERIEAELIYENNISLRQQLAFLTADLHALSQIIQSETAARRATLEVIESAIFEWDKEGSCVWVNAAYRELVGRTFEQIRGENWRNSIHDLDRKMVVENWEKSIEDKTDFRSRFRVTNEKAEFWVTCEAVCNKDELGNVLGFVGKLWKIEKNL